MTNRTFIGALVILTAVLALGIFITACQRSDNAATASSVPGFLDVALPPHPDATAATLARGKELYDVNCAKCHGDDGRGVGPSSATLLDAKGKYINTRDFTFATSYRTLAVWILGPLALAVRIRSVRDV